VVVIIKDTGPKYFEVKIPDKSAIPLKGKLKNWAEKVS
jgi:hypothetical protein